MSAEVFSANLTDNFENQTDFPMVCQFQGITNAWDLLDLFKRKECYRHTTGYTVFLCIANLLILTLGLVGNFFVIYVVTLKIKSRTASSVFILNLAVADLLVIFCCIPATHFGNLFMPWIFGDLMCKLVAYGQGVSVFSSVYSLVAISFDRFRAIYYSVSLSHNVSIKHANRVVIFIWILGLAVTFPWAAVFRVNILNPYDYPGAPPNTSEYTQLPFCQEVWDTKKQEIVYFLVVHVVACFLLPIGVITVCNVVIWRNVLNTHTSDVTLSPLSTRWCLKENQRRRKLRVLRMFTGLTFAFFLFWLPLYVIMVRVKLFYTKDFLGTNWEQNYVPVLLPAAQLLGSCNSCVNPVLYALLNTKFRQNFKEIFICPFGSLLKTKLISAMVCTKKGTGDSVVKEEGQMRDTPV